MANEEAKRTILYGGGLASVVDAPADRDIHRTLPGWSAPSSERALAACPASVLPAPSPQRRVIVGREAAATPELYSSETLPASSEGFYEAQDAGEIGRQRDLRGTWTHMLASWQLEGDPEPELERDFIVQLRSQRRKSLLMVLAVGAGLALALAALWASYSARGGHEGQERRLSEGRALSPQPAAASKETHDGRVPGSQGQRAAVSAELTAKAALREALRVKRPQVRYDRQNNVLEILLPDGAPEPQIKLKQDKVSSR